MTLSGKVFIITGAGSGIGREMALILLGKGARVALVGRTASKLEETASLAGSNSDKASIHAVDTTDLKAVEALPQQVIDAQGAIDALINNAGIIQPFKTVAELDYQTIEKVMHINFYGTLYMTKTFIPYLVNRPQAHIANVSSMGGFLPVPGQSIYGATKAAVKLFTEALHSELMDTPVNVSIILPGAMSTNIAVNSGVDISHMSDSKNEYKSLEATKAAQIIIDGIAKNQYRILVGSDSKMMDLFYRINPKWAAELIYKKMRSLLAKP